MDDETFLAMERRSQVQRDILRKMLADSGHHDVLAWFDAKMRDIDLGIDGARATWGALSQAQRRVLESMGDGRALRRASASRTRYDAINADRKIDLDSDFNICGLPTARNLSARELIVVAGGALDPEAKFVITERGQFVLEHGPAHP